MRRILDWSQHNVHRTLTLCWGAMAALYHFHGVPKHALAEKATGVFMNLTAKKATRLVGVKADLTASAEVHEMKMEKDVMKMQAVKALDLPAGQTVALKPGSYHVMLMDLKAPVVEDSQVVLTLLFEDAAGVKTQKEVKAVAKKMGMGVKDKPQHGEHKH
jgi:homoserine O-succinyltransferase